MTPSSSSTRERLSRRDTLRLAGGAGITAVLAGRSSPLVAAQESGDAITVPDTGAALPAEEVTFRWLDSGDVKSFFWEAFFPKYEEAHPNITAQYEGLPWNEIGQIVPIGVQNGNAPDVFQIPQNIPDAQAMAEGWIAPLDDLIPNFAEWKAAFPEGSFLPGFTVFNGKTYGLPLTSNKQYGTMLLYNQDHMQAAGYDPSANPLTWDQFREAARKITEQGQGQYYGLIFGGSQIARYEAFVSNLARMAGASAGGGGIDWRTGEYVYTSDQYLAAIELLQALQADGSIFPGSTSLNAPEARAQMPLGVAGMILQGPWNIPQWQQENPDFQFGVASQPLPNSGEPVPLTVEPQDGSYWIYAESPHKAIAADIFAYMGTVEGQRAWGQIVGVSDPPIFPEAQQEGADDPRASKAYELFDQQVRLGPDPRVRNAEAAQVYLEMQPIQPRFGQVVQGLFTGQLTDARQAMQDLTNRSEAELERAITAAQDKGAQVSRDDWVFANWDPAQDYTEDDYAGLS